MANFPTGVGQVTLAQMLAGEVVTVGPLTYDLWQILDQRTFPADAVVNFLSPTELQLTGSFAPAVGYVWVYRVTAPLTAQLDQVDVDFEQLPNPAATKYSVLTTIFYPKGTNPATGAHQNIFDCKLGGVVVQANTTVTFAPGTHSVWTENSFILSDPISFVANTWSMGGS